ncbi:hypothetical protein ACFWDG_15295, partial [Peribacillus sp. NPDC060186]
LNDGQKWITHSMFFQLERVIKPLFHATTGEILMDEFWVRILFMVVVGAVIGGALIYWLSGCCLDLIN